MKRPFRCWMLQTPWNHSRAESLFGEIEQAAGRANEFGLSALMLTEVNLHRLVKYPHFPLLDEQGFEPERKQAYVAHVRRFTEICRQNKLEPYLFCFELLELNRIGQPYPQALDPNASMLWEITAERLRQTYELFPDLAGVEVYLDEGSAANVSHLGRYGMPAPEIVARLAHTYLRASRPLGKNVIFSTFTNEMYRLRDLQADWKLVPPAPDFFVNNWIVPGDWGEYLTHQPLIGDVGGHQEIITFDFSCENWGQCQTPMCYVDYLRERWTDALDRSRHVIGFNGWALWGWHYDNPQARPFVLGTANEVNAFALAQLVDDPRLSSEAIWERWARRLTADPDAATRVTAALRRTQRIGELAWMVKGFWFMEWPKSFLPGFRFMLHSPYNESTAEWDETLRPIEDGIFYPDAELVDDVVRDREEALRLAQQSLAEVREVQSVLLPPWQEVLPASLERLVAFCRASRYHTELFLRWKLWWLRRPGGEPERIAHCAQELGGLAAELEERFGPELWPANPGRMRSLVRQVEQMMEFGHCPVGQWSNRLRSPVSKRYAHRILDLLASLTDDHGGWPRAAVPPDRAHVLEEVGRLTGQWIYVVDVPDGK